MEAFAQAVQAGWPVVLTTVSLIAWFVRLEAKVLYLERDRLDQKETATARETVLWAKLDLMQAAVLELTKQVAKLEGVLQAKRE